MEEIPPRGFENKEFEMRMQRVQARMSDEKMDAILLTTEPDVRYFTGFFSQFWESPTRPWFVLLPLSGKPIAVIPEIGAAGMDSGATHSSCFSVGKAEICKYIWF